MADFLASKAPTEIVQRRWSVPVDRDDGAQSAAVTGTGVTVVSDSLEGDDLVLTLSGGLAASTGSIAVTVTTSRGRLLAETLYIPVVETGSSAATALDIITFALRKVFGLDETPDASAASHALECLSDMLRVWRASGADVGATFPIETTTVLHMPESYLSAVKNNLIVEASELFDREVTPTVARNAARGLQHIKQANLSGPRDAVYF